MASQRTKPEMPQEMSMAEMQAEMDALRAENKSLKGTNGLTFKVSPKGAVSIYGMGGFPTTLYKDQWERILDSADSLRDFMEQNQDRLSSKNG